MLCKTIFLLVIARLSTGVVIEAPVDFSQHKVIRILPNRITQLNALEKIRTDFKVSFQIIFYQNFFYFFSQNETNIYLSTISKID
jgi:poly(3-hydroxyalkanoate) synthetase